MTRAQIDFFKSQYPPGTRVQLDNMGDDPRPIPSGTKGTVLVVDDIGTLHCKFDNGRQLGICPELDSFHKICEPTEVVSESEPPKSTPKLSM